VCARARACCVGVQSGCQQRVVRRLLRGLLWECTYLCVRARAYCVGLHLVCVYDEECQRVVRGRCGCVSGLMGVCACDRGVIVVSIVFEGGEVCIAYTSVLVNLWDPKHVLGYLYEYC